MTFVDSAEVFLRKMQAINKLTFNKQIHVFRILTSSVHTSRACLKAEDRKEMLASMPVRNQNIAWKVEWIENIFPGERWRRWRRKNHLDWYTDPKVSFLITLNVYSIIQWICFRKGNIYPDENTPTSLFYGIPFNEIPIVNIKTSPNNTIMSLTNAKGDTQILRSCGIEGFKNTRKGTNIAAQATAISISGKILERGIKAVRVAVRGLGPGRMVVFKLHN